MVRCYDCGQPIRDGDIIRCTVRTGTSWGRRSYRSYYHKVNLCPSCSASRDRAALTMLLVFLGIGGGLLVMCLVGSLINVLSPHPAAPAITAAPVPAAYEFSGTLTYADVASRQIGVNHATAVATIPAGNRRFSVAPDAAAGQPWPGVPVGGQVVCVLETRNGQWLVTRIRPGP